jgi:hypothetical protein
MLAKSGELRCPVCKNAEGQSRTKQSRLYEIGVCREQMPAAKAKVCSDLYGNIQRTAEMTVLAMSYVIW